MWAKGKSSLRLVSALWLVIIYGVATPAHAELKEDPQETLFRVEKYLSTLHSLRAKFQQVAPDGGLASGIFYLERPGKMRWQYDPPVPVLMLSNGSVLTFIDFELEQVSRVPLSSTLAGFITKEIISFKDPAIRIVDMGIGAGSVRISLVQRESPGDGMLTLHFDDQNSLVLRRMVITDAAGQTTDVQLKDAQFNLALDDSLFEFVDPRKGGRREPIRR